MKIAIHSLREIDTSLSRFDNNAASIARIWEPSDQPCPLEPIEG